MSNSTAVEPFDFNGREILVISIGGEPWFVARDVCAALGIVNYRDAVSRLDDDEKVDHAVGNTDTLVKLVNEAGVYALVFASRKPEAREFKRWVRHEVLPSIRRTGAYVASPTPVRNADLVALRAMLDAIEETRAEQERQAAALTVVNEQQRDHDARLAAIEGRHDWYSALGFARLHNLPTSHVWLQRLGYTAGQIGRRHGVVTHKVQHAHYGEVNSWPEWVWTAAVEARRAAGDPSL